MVWCHPPSLEILPFANKLTMPLGHELHYSLNGEGEAAATKSKPATSLEKPERSMVKASQLCSESAFLLHQRGIDTSKHNSLQLAASLQLRLLLTRFSLPRLHPNRVHDETNMTTQSNQLHPLIHNDNLHIHPAILNLLRSRPYK